MILRGTVPLRQDDQPLWVGLTTDPTDERDFPNGKFIQLTAGSSVAIDAQLATAEDLFSNSEVGSVNSGLINPCLFNWGCTQKSDKSLVKVDAFECFLNAFFLAKKQRKMPRMVPLKA